MIEIAPGIFTLRAFTVPECRSIVAMAERAGPWRGASINDALDVDRTIRDADVIEKAAHPTLFAMLHERLFSVTAPLAATLAPQTVLAEVQLVRYRAGGRYVEHRDTPATGGTPRALSIVAYLNDDFSGGATAFVDPAVSIAPKSGTVVVFSPALVHRAEPVVDGIKFAITAWYHVLPASFGAPDGGENRAIVRHSAVGREPSF